MFLINAFSVNMLPAGSPATVTFSPLTVADAAALVADCTSAVGHADTANVIATVLGVPVAMNRATVTLSPGDRALLAQYRGPRLAEGATTLPDGATLDFLLVTIA